MSIVPRDVKRALKLLRADLACDRRIDEVAAECEVAQRTLQKHFRRFVGMTPAHARQQARLEQARRKLLRAQRHESVTSIATGCGFRHLGRFADAYRERYGELPSTTMRRRSAWLSDSAQLPRILSPKAERPVITVCPFDVVGEAAHVQSTIVDEISVALMRNRWLVVGAPSGARYQLRGKVRHDCGQRHSIFVVVTDAATGRNIWADRWSGEVGTICIFEERSAVRIAAAVDQALRVAEIDRVDRKPLAHLGAWELTMKALPRALTLNSPAQQEALDLLERAMEVAPDDALPVALAAWCHAQRGTHHFGRDTGSEKRLGRELVVRAKRLGGCDARTEALLAAAETLGHDLASGAMHCERALALDGGCTWAWIRNGFVHAYAGRSADAIECFQIARGLGPDDPLIFSTSIGIGIAHFEACNFEGAVRCWTQLLFEHPAAVWAHRFLAPAFLLAGRQDDARQSFGRLAEAYPELTISEVRSVLPHTQSYMDRAGDALDSLGMRP